MSENDELRAKLYRLKAGARDGYAKREWYVKEVVRLNSELARFHAELRDQKALVKEAVREGGN